MIFTKEFYEIMVVFEKNAKMESTAYQIMVICGLLTLIILYISESIKKHHKNK
jgi:hypothetical protein